jgi:hypothetical protein
MDYEYVASMTGIWDALSPGAQAALKHIGENCFKKGLVKKANFFDPNEKVTIILISVDRTYREYFSQTKGPKW